MVFLLILLFLILVIGILLYAIPFQISFLLDTDRTDLHARCRWLYPFVEIRADMIRFAPRISVFLFKKKVYSKVQQPGEKRKSRLIRYLRHLSLQDTQINAEYGLGDPFETAIANVLFHAAHSLTGGVFESRPDYASDHAYVIVRGQSDLYVGKTVLNALQKNPK